MAVYIEEKSEDQQASDDENAEAGLPPLTEGEALKLIKLDPKQHFTQPPPRFSEALLVKTLEEKGIGRPSTYAAIICDHPGPRLRREGREQVPSDRARRTGDKLLIQHFANVLDVQFTARMEEELDKIEEGGMKWTAAVRDFYEPFAKDLAEAVAGMKDFKAEQTPTNISCDKCGKPMIMKWGRNGQFLACSGYPDCKNTRPFVRTEDGGIEAAPEETTDEICPKCGSGMVVKRGRFGKFLACANYPACKSVKPLTTGVACPEPGCTSSVCRRPPGSWRSSTFSTAPPRVDCCGW